MNCSCDYDPPEFWSKDMRRARKVHVCEECRARIQPGETYEYVSGKWDGYFETFNTCARCVDLRQWMTNNLPCFCWAHGNLFEDVREAADEAYQRAGDEVKGLRFGVYRRIIKIEKAAAASRELIAA